MENYIINNVKKNQKLKDILIQNGIEFDKNNTMTNIKEIGFGANGVVYQIGDTDKVLKITSNGNELHAIEELIEASQDDISIKHYFEIPLVLLPTNENFYEQLTQQDIKENNIHLRYYFIYNKLHKLSTSEREVFETIFEYFGEINIEDIYNFLGDNDIRDYEEDVFKYIDDSDLIANDNQYVNSIWNFICIIYDYSIEYLLHDIHIENIMKDDNGNYKIIDALI